ncbi:MAG: PilZ domain-containing protein [Sedimenticola sp.]|uniref:PilZ domain-containing protein n=1 Tax=Sedimenticola thiotaurini TaxID=1543721 RepID=A0A558CUI3_9GAMM|nr:PilZ domain-containing protein [Sedimenticola sp.]MCW8921155.1 PilZ domain-containing protein [Sedimenticola sp.]MCW8947757.1 PilZ domain-containing protein [Sedimenticola sp.]MDF1530410.1 PilZ domain-containing protein [Sedimenticola sp.]TVT52403.1 MAG: PilZ domain-containing protein [Sedimenticola thiotaurini]
MSDKRSQPRKVCDTRIDILDAESDQVIGNLVNISMSGFMMITNQSLPENYVFQFKIAFETEQAGAHVIQVGAESLWVQEVEGSAQRWMGFHIIDISESDLEIIAALIGDWRE